MIFKSRLESVKRVFATHTRIYYYYYFKITKLTLKRAITFLMHLLPVSMYLLYLYITITFFLIPVHDYKLIYDSKNKYKLKVKITFYLYQ